MRKLLALLLVLSVLMLSACQSRQGQERAGGPVEKMAAPDITVEALNGTRLKLSDLKGKVVMLNFWATWCPPCRGEIPSMMKLNAAMAGAPFQMVAVSIDEGGKAVVESFFKASGYSLPAYVDPSGGASRTYGITGVPETFIIDKSGIIVKKIIGPLDWSAPEVLTFFQGMLK